jgi:hypothetical protein
MKKNKKKWWKNVDEKRKWKFHEEKQLSEIKIEEIKKN